MDGTAGWLAPDRRECCAAPVVSSGTCELVHVRYGSSCLRRQAGRQAGGQAQK